MGFIGDADDVEDDNDGGDDWMFQTFDKKNGTN